MKLILTLLTLLICLPSFARDFRKIQIPGAFCGKGEPYSVYVDFRNPYKLAFEFMGGGACWSKETCIDPENAKTYLSLLPAPLPSKMHYDAIYKSPLTEHTLVYFPYCTGDVFAGIHNANYDGYRVNHTGYYNTVVALNYLQATGLIKFFHAQEAVVYGSSAGAIGALLHTATLNRFLPHTTRKFAIADSPGLHFGPTFWSKFPDNMVNDFAQAFAQVGMTFEYPNGNVAPGMTNVCNTLSDWQIGIIQSSKDIVMSYMYGDISPSEHRQLVYGPYGLLAAVSNTNNCFSWLPDSFIHTFYLYPFGYSIGGIGPVHFANLLLNGNGRHWHQAHGAF